MGWVRLLQKICPALTSFINRHLVPKGLLVFHSPYLNNDMKLTFPLKQQQLLFSCFQSNDRCPERDCNRNEHEDTFHIINVLKEKFENWFGDDENYGSEEFLQKARDILIQEKLNKMKRRREELEKKRRKKKQEKRDERIKSIEAMLRKSIDDSGDNVFAEVYSPKNEKL